MTTAHNTTRDTIRPYLVQRFVASRSRRPNAKYLPHRAPYYDGLERNYVRQLLVPA